MGLGGAIESQEARGWAHSLNGVCVALLLSNTCWTSILSLITTPRPPPPGRRMMGSFAATQASLVQSSADLWASMAKQFEEPAAEAE